jgi:hypothetical protein
MRQRLRENVVRRFFPLHPTSLIACVLDPRVKWIVDRKLLGFNALDRKTADSVLQEYLDLTQAPAEAGGRAHAPPAAVLAPVHARQRPGQLQGMNQQLDAITAELEREIRAVAAHLGVPPAVLPLPLLCTLHT